MPVSCAAPLRERDCMAVLVVSPHLDDGVFSCGEMMADHPTAHLVTVFAGRPATAQLTEWDRDCGFAAGDDVVGARRDEDARSSGPSTRRSSPTRTRRTARSTGSSRAGWPSSRPMGSTCALRPVWPV